jgi:hypothetical protein
VGNLPYNISTPILFHLLDHVAVVQDQHFMLQKEVIDRMVASPASSDYSRLSVMLQWRYAMDNVLFVPPESFDPPPRVDSAIVRMVPLAEPPAIDIRFYGELVQTAFSQRRKILRNTLGKWLDARDFSGTFDVQRRAEEVPVHEYVALCQAVQQAASQHAGVKKPLQAAARTSPRAQRIWLRQAASAAPLGGDAAHGRRRGGGSLQAAANQYPALNGLLMRSAMGLTSSSLSVGMGSSLSTSICSSPLGVRATENE